MGKMPANPALDVWSMGCILVEMLTGEPAFDAPNKKDLQVKISDGEFCLKTEIKKTLTQSIIDLIEKMFIIDYNERISVIDISNDDWILKEISEL